MATKTATLPRMWTSEEMSKHFGKSVRALREWRELGRDDDGRPLRGPDWIYAGKQPLYPEDRIVAWVNAGGDKR